MEQYLPPFTAALLISTNEPQKIQHTVNAADAFLTACYNYINDNIDSDLSVGTLATKMFVSKSTLNRRLLMLTGLSANEIIRQCRLKKAAELLSAGKNVSETAYLSGFETPSYFIHCFREVFKQTPKKYAQIVSGFRHDKNDSGDNMAWQMKIA